MPPACRAVWAVCRLCGQWLQHAASERACCSGRVQGPSLLLTVGCTFVQSGDRKRLNVAHPWHVCWGAMRCVLQAAQRPATTPGPGGSITSPLPAALIPKAAGLRPSSSTSSVSQRTPAAAPSQACESAATATPEPGPGVTPSASRPATGGEAGSGCLPAAALPPPPGSGSRGAPAHVEYSVRAGMELTAVLQAQLAGLQREHVCLLA